MFPGVKSGSPRVLPPCRDDSHSDLFGEEILAGQDEVVKRFCRGTVHLRSHWGFGHQLNPCPPTPWPDCDPCPPPPEMSVPSGCCVVMLGQEDGAAAKRTSQRSSERFWIASATAVRRRAMTERGSSLPITALPDTIMLAPAWSTHTEVGT